MIDKRFRYGAKEDAFYQEHGYCLFDHFLTQQALEAVRKQLNLVISQRHPKVPPEQMVGTHQQEAWVLVESPRFPLPNVIGILRL